MKDKKQKGYVLVFVMVLMLALSVTLVSASVIIFRYMSHAKGNMPEQIYYQTEEVLDYGSF
ncbi:MAG: hypothetical protein IJ360_03710 [Clostridia bacterium]|nr:hypothetical protein [Clostridia bacterium]